MRTLLSGRKMKATDAKTIQEIGIPSMVLMERAAMAVAAEAEKAAKKDEIVWAVCGSGNNGADGIAVGMATSIPPHNLGEVVDAVKAYMKNNDISVKGLMRYLKGPDFPTGGLVVNKDDLLRIYETGTGKLRVRGKVETVKLKGGRQQLVDQQRFLTQ